MLWEIYGFPLRRQHRPTDKFTSCLFICLGNICRSPFAEYLAREIAKQKGITHLCFESAGLKVDKPFSSPKNAVLAASNFGISLENHRSKPIDLQMIEANDVIFAMEARHVSELKKIYPMIAGKIALIPLIDPKHGKPGGGYLRHNIPDPFGKSLDEFTTCYVHIQRCLSSLFKK